MRNTNNIPSMDNFDQIIVNRLIADDFAQPQIKDAAFYKNKAATQIKSSIQAIFNASNQHEFTTAIAQANAFIDAAMDFEFIDISEKGKWLDDIANAVRTQTIGESA